MSSKTKQSETNFLNETLSFLTTRRFFIHLGLIILFFFVVLWLILFFLKSYTNHGQQIELPQYVGVDIDEAIKDAKDNTFQIVVTDSIHRLNVPGGQILNQNPVGGDKVKQNRKIYVTTAKHSADRIKAEYLLPKNTYGSDYELLRKNIEANDVMTKVEGFRIDRGVEPNTILEVSYKGQVIVSGSTFRKDVQVAKGDTLSMWLTKNEGGEIEIPDLLCSTLSSARFLLDGYQLNAGEIIPSGDITNLEDSYVYKQVPIYDGINHIGIGETITLYVTQEKPDRCD